MSTSEQPPGREWVTSCAFVVIGLLILIPSGLCTAIWGYLTIADIAQRGDLIGTLQTGAFFLIISAAFVALAIFLIVLGFRQRKPK